jgi:hypothetical protein
MSARNTSKTHEGVIISDKGISMTSEELPALRAALNTWQRAYPSNRSIAQQRFGVPSAIVRVNYGSRLLPPGPEPRDPNETPRYHVGIIDIIDHPQGLGWGTVAGFASATDIQETAAKIRKLSGTADLTSLSLPDPALSRAAKLKMGLWSDDVYVDEGSFECSFVMYAPGIAGSRATHKIWDVERRPGSDSESSIMDGTKKGVFLYRQDFVSPEDHSILPGHAVRRCMWLWFDPESAAWMPLTGAWLARSGGNVRVHEYAKDAVAGPLIPA